MDNSLILYTYVAPRIRLIVFCGNRPQHGLVEQTELAVLIPKAAIMTTNLMSCFCANTLFFEEVCTAMYYIICVTL